MEHTGQPGQVSRREWLIVAAVGIITFIAFTIWGGVPSGDRMASFVLIVGVMLALTCLFVVATWHLLVRPLPAGQKQKTDAVLPATTRQFIAVLLAVGGLCLVVGPFWDEIWHRMYGIPFGEDFFWRPHLLIYFGFGSSALLGFWGLYHIMTHHQGTFQQRFRANLLVGLIIMSSAFLMYVVPADPVWHKIYGRDLSAWSVPHLLLLITIALVMLMAALVHLSTLPVRAWRAVVKIGATDILPLLMYAGMLMPWLQILMIDWDGTLTDSARVTDHFRPDWLMAGCIVFVATFIGILANRSLRYVGAATLSGVIALVLRYGMIQIFHVTEFMHYEAWVLALLPLLAVDIWMGYKIFQAKGTPTWIETGIAGAVGMIIAIPLLGSLYPTVLSGNIIPVILAILAAAMGASWAGTQFGEYAATHNRQAAEPARSYAPALSMGTIAAFAFFVLFFITTAAPPM